MPTRHIDYRPSIYSLAFLILLLIPQSAFCKTFYVINTSDSGSGSLSEAISYANANPGADSILFNIPQNDKNYNTNTGIWIITLNTQLPLILDSGLTLDATSQPGYLSSPIITIIPGNTSFKTWAIAIVSSHNVIKGFNICGFENGILISEPSGCYNRIENCFLGTDYTGTIANPNENGITLNNSANYNVVANNLISGNNLAGIIIKKSNNNQIIGNKIGCDISGNQHLSNENGIIIDSSSSNYIGSPTLPHKNIISGNYNCGILITGRTSCYNSIQNNHIGTNITGNSYLSNLNGIAIIKSSHNQIGRGNLISGNSDIGILISGKYSNQNKIIGNLIGTDLTGTQLLKNDKGIVIKSLANSNLIGGHHATDRNIISGNIQIGIYIEAADSNQIKGNFIGTDLYGQKKISVKNALGQDSLVQGNGIEFNTVARYNSIGGPSFGERNIISGHKVYGIVHYGNCSNNSTINNFIGTDITSQKAIPNATGICFDCASHHNEVRSCVMSGNLSYGLFYVTRGTEYNSLTGCMIGVDSSGTKSVANDIGMVISTGTANNVIGGHLPTERNIFSGNNLSGLMITNQLTQNNTIKGNYFGTDISGKLAIPNLYGILLSTYTKGNTIENNLISGNSQSGIIMTESADSNYITLNKIGIALDDESPIPNGAGGIFLDQGATHNIIGTPDKPNTIAFNKGGGILIKNNNTKFNRLSGNSIFGNEGLGIDIFPFGQVNQNDLGDQDTGPSELLNFPVLSKALYTPVTTTLSGQIDTDNPEKVTIEVYFAYPDSSHHGQAKSLCAIATPDPSGSFTIQLENVPLTTQLTAIAIDQNGNTSEFAHNTSLTTTTFNTLSPNQKISIFPNPVSTNLCLHHLNPSLCYDLKAINQNGITIFTDAFCYSSSYCTNISQLNKTSLSPGSYIIIVTDNHGETSSYKIIII